MFYLWPENIWQQLPRDLTRKGNYRQIPGVASTVQQCLTVRQSVGLFSDAPSLLLTDSKKIPALLHHQDWVHSLSFPSLQRQRQILQQLHKRKLKRMTQFSRRESPSPKMGHLIEYWRFLFFNCDPYPTHFGCVLLTTVISPI